MKQTFFYQQPLFAWCLLFTFTPLGIIFLWLYKHYNFLLRLMITLLFIPLFKMNLFVGAIILMIGFYQTLGAQHQLFFHAKTEAVSEEVEDFVSLELLQSFTLIDFIHLFTNIYDSEGYDLKKILSINDIEWMAHYKKQHKNQLIYFKMNEPTTKNDVLTAFHQQIDMSCNQIIIVSNVPPTLYAQETALKSTKVLLWSLEDVWRLIKTHMTSLEELHHHLKSPHPLLVSL